jgi:signal transduction histidine kinase/ActR/RegA family two-component response regulator
VQVRMRRISITARLLSYLVLAGIVPLVLLGTSAFEISRRIIIKQAGEFHLQQVNDLRAYLALYSDQVESLAANVAGNEAIGEALRVGKALDKRTTDTYSALITQAQIGYILNSYVRVKGLVSIDLFSRDGKHFHVGDTLDVRDVDTARVQQMLVEASASTTPVYWRGIEDNLNRASTQSRVMTVTRGIRYYVPQAGTTEVVGLLVINIDANLVINEFLNEVKTPEHLRLMLLDRNGRFGYHSNPALLGQSAAPGLVDLVKAGPPIQEVKLDGQEVILGYVPFDRIGGGLIGVLPRSVLTAPTYALIYAGLVLLLIGIAGISLLAWRFVRHVVVPVRDVSEGFSRLQEHPDKPPAALPLPNTGDEMADLVVGFNRHLDVLAAQQLASHQLLEAQQAAEAASRAKSQFLATMSHEIRTPMNGILGMAQLLLMSDLTEQERLEYARTILHSGDTLLTLLNDILDLSKVEAGKLELQFSAFAPRQLISETAALFREPIESKGLRLESNWRGPDNIRYWGDALRLRQMLSNLVSNAAKFTAQGVIRIEGSEIEQKNDGVLMEFSVTDSGLGIPKDKLDRLFKPFSQVDGSITRQYGGSGLGLSIVSNLARMMGGDTGIESEPGRGSRVWFRVWVACIPIEQDSRQGERTAIAAKAQDTAQSSVGYVLVVEDNLTNRKVIEGLLRKQGVHFDSVENGLEAVKLITGGARPALVLMDCQMPVMDGYEATERIREWEGQHDGSRIPIVALTAGAYQEDRDKCIAAGMDDFLAKPLRLTDLQAVLRKWLGADQDARPG